MENRFGVKDLFLFLLLGGIVVLVVLGMVQYDRQWDQIQQTNRLLKDQSGDLSRIRQLLEQGITVNGSGGNGGPTSRPAPNAIAQRILKAQSMPGYSRGDWLVQTFSVIPDRLTPLISTDLYSSDVQSAVLESLCDRDPVTLKWVPTIAESFKVSEDGLRIDFVIRRGVTFSDGEPLTADDVLWTYNWIMNPQVECPRDKAYYEKVKSVEQQGDYAVSFTFKEPYFKAMELAAGMPILPKHFYSKFTPEQYNRSTGLLMGSGPYRLADPEGWRPEPGKPVELVRNERYWSVPPAFDRLVWRVIQLDAARLTTFRNGDIDLYDRIDPEQYKAMLGDPELLSRTQHYEYYTPVKGYLYCGWNEFRNGKPTPFADKRVRRAMTMLTDRQRIINDIFLGYGRVSTGPFSKLSPQYNQAIQPIPYDPAKAKELLKEAGYADRNGDGVLEGPDGKPFKFKVAYNAGSDVRGRMVLLMKDTFAKAGVLVEPEPLEWSVLLQRLQKTRDFDAAVLGWGGVIEADPYQIFHSSQIEGTGDDYVHYANPELDKVIEQARTTADEQKRTELWHKVHAILHEDQPYTFLVDQEELTFMSSRIKNVQQVSVGLNSAYEWFVPKGDHKWAP
jgi:peptide/nickel transport system substrate-binding protein